MLFSSAAIQDSRLFCEDSLFPLASSMYFTLYVGLSVMLQNMNMKKYFERFCDFFISLNFVHIPIHDFLCLSILMLSFLLYGQMDSKLYWISYSLA